MRLFERLSDVTDLNSDEVARAFQEAQEVTIQYSRPIYDARVLERLDQIAAEFGERVAVRFYGHDGQVFDASVVTALQSVKNLLIDCLDATTNLDALKALPNLTRLALGVAVPADQNFLASDAFRNLRSLVVGEAAKMLDLSPVADMRDLRTLTICANIRGMDQIAGSLNLSELRLSSIPSKASLNFVNKLSALQVLEIGLGGRESLEGIALPDLTSLKVDRVRGFDRLALNAFPALESLTVADQIRLAKVDFRSGPKNLRDLAIVNCKTFAGAPGLEALPALRSLRLAMTAMDLEALIEQLNLERLEMLALYTGRTESDRAVRNKLAALGGGHLLTPELHG